MPSGECNELSAKGAPRRRSRSPRRGAAASGILRTLDVGKMQLKLGDYIAKVVYFDDGDIWFEAKPVTLHLEYSPTHVGQTLNFVKANYKKSLKELLDTKGPPKWGDLSDKSPQGHNDLIAWYINEPGVSFPQ